MRCISALFVHIGFSVYGKISTNQVHSNPRNILTLGSEIKKLAKGTYCSTRYQGKRCKKNVVGGHFLTEHIRVTN